MRSGICSWRTVKSESLCISYKINAFFILCYLEKAVIAKSSLLLDVKPWDDETGI